MSQVSNDISERYLEFELGEENFAIPLLQVRELISVPETTSVPFSPSYYVGIMNLRGQVISIVDLRKRLNIKNAESNEEAVVIVEFGDLSLGVVVDSICKVLNITTDEIQDVASIESSSSDEISKVFRNGEALIQLIDLSKILNISELNSMSAKAA